MRHPDVHGLAPVIGAVLLQDAESRRGASVTYSLNAHSPRADYRVTVSGTEGRAELEVVERAAVLPDPDGVVLEASSVGDTTDGAGRHRCGRPRRWRCAAARSTS